MSWKSIVTAGLLCVLVTPAFAAPTMSIDLVRSGGIPVLAANGDWQWRVSVAADPALFPPGLGGGSLELELGLDFSGAALTGATRNVANFDRLNPGTQIFAWETLTDVGGGNMRPVGLQTNPATGQVFAALGSIVFADGALKEVMTLTTAAPSTVGPNLTTGVQWLGAFGGNALIGQDDGVVGTPNVYTAGLSGTLSKTVLGGDANFDGDVNFTDYQILTVNYNTPPAPALNWNHADFNNDNDVNFTDYQIITVSYNTPPIPPPGSGGFGAAVPEPTSAVICILGICAMGLFGRRRS